MRAFAYVRVSTDRQGESGLGLEAQVEAVGREVAHRGWTLSETFVDTGSGKNLHRPELQRLLDLLGEGDVLVVAKLDRLSRSLLDFAGLMARSRREGWGLVALDLNVDTTTPAGGLMANVMASFAEYERQIISQRTRDALQAKRAQGHRLGRPNVLTEAQRSRIIELAGERGYAPTARLLNEEGMPTGCGGRQWWPSSVRSVVMAG